MKITAPELLSQHINIIRGSHTEQRKIMGRDANMINIFAMWDKIN